MSQAASPSMKHTSDRYFERVASKVPDNSVRCSLATVEIRLPQPHEEDVGHGLPAPQSVGLSE